MISVAAMLAFLWWGIVGFVGGVLILYLVIKEIYERCHPEPPPVFVERDFAKEARDAAFYKARDDARERLIELKGGRACIAVINRYKLTVEYEKELAVNPNARWLNFGTPMDAYQKRVTEGYIARQKENGVYVEEYEKYIE